MGSDDSKPTPQQQLNSAKSTISYQEDVINRKNQKVNELEEEKKERNKK